MTMLAEPVDDPALPAVVVEAHGRRGRRALARSTGTVAAMVWIGGWTVAAVLADLLPLDDPLVRVASSRSRPMAEGHLLGTDALGRDILSRLVYGARTSLAVGLAAAGLAFVLGGLVGLLAGAAGRRTDAAVGVGTDTILAVPGIVLLLFLATLLQPSTGTLVVGLAVIALPTFVRLARANALRCAGSDYVVAARALGARSHRVVFRELLPNALPPVLAYGLLVVATLVIAEASVSYLGLGIPPPSPSWGNMIAAGQTELELHPHMALVPAAVLFFTVLALNALGQRVIERVSGERRARGRDRSARR